MAMTKAERAELDALRTRLALRWPDTPPAPVDLAMAREATTAKWLRLWWFNTGSGYTGVGTVGRGVTNGLSTHARADYTDEELANQYKPGSKYLSMGQTSGGPWFATKADALAALHHATARRCPETLRQVEVLREEEADAQAKATHP